MDKRLMLASGSPRRKVLMQCMGLDFEVIPSSFEEHLDQDRSPSEVAIELGLGKALDVARQYPDAYVIGSDLIIVHNGVQFEKPKDAEDARRMLRLLSGSMHQAVCSLALVCIQDGVNEVLAVSCNIEMRQLPDKLIEAYIATGDPFDKAAGYSRQHPLLHEYVLVKGDVHLASGLPTAELRKLLEAHGMHVPLSEDETRRRYAASDLADQNVLV